jgi:ribosome-associated toxin RatA of RatAB toxin-antitoxin module
MRFLMKMDRMMKVVTGSMFLAIALGGQAWADEGAAIEAIGGQANWAVVQAGEVVVLKPDTSQDDGPRHVVAGILIDAPVKTVWDSIADKEGAPQYVENLKSARILEKNSEYMLIEQKMKLSILLPSFTYVVRHTPIPYSRVDFVRESGDMKHIEGYWKFVPVADGEKTLLIYSLYVDPGPLIPQAIIRGSMKKSLPDVLRILQKRCAEVSGR